MWPAESGRVDMVTLNMLHRMIATHHTGGLEPPDFGRTRSSRQDEIDRSSTVSE